jgi:hypothetical protein
MIVSPEGPGGGPRPYWSRSALTAHLGRLGAVSQKFPFARSSNAGGFFHRDPFVRKYLLVMGAGLPMQTT